MLIPAVSRGPAHVRVILVEFRTRSRALTQLTFLVRKSGAECNMIYGYARVSTDGQSVDAQVKQLRAAVAARVYSETASGGAQIALSTVVSSPTLARATCSWYRLARSTRALLNSPSRYCEQRVRQKPHLRLLL
jgi:hypothetical protein